MKILKINSIALMTVISLVIHVMFAADDSEQWPHYLRNQRSYIEDPALMLDNEQRLTEVVTRLIDWAHRAESEQELEKVIDSLNSHVSKEQKT